MKSPTHVVRIDGLAARINRREVGVSALRKFGCDTPATIQFVEVKIFSKSFSAVAEIGVVFDVISQRTFLIHRRAGLRGAERLFTNRPRGQGSSTGLREIVRAVFAVAQSETGNHPPQTARRIGRIGITVRPVKRKTILHPAENGRMFLRRVAALAISFCRGIEINVVAEFVAQRDGFDMIMISAAILLVCERGVESPALVWKRVAVPDAVAVATAAAGTEIAAGRAGVRPRIAGIKHPHAVHEHPDFAEMIKIIFGLNFRMTRDRKNKMLVGGQVGKPAVLPRPHDLAAEAGAENVNPVGRRNDFLHTAIRRL